MRVAIDGRSLESPVFRGFGRYTSCITAALRRKGVELTVFHRARRPLHAAHVAALGCEVQGLEDRCGIHWEQVAVPRALRRGGYDLYHAPAECGVPFSAPCPTVLTIHSVTSRSYARLVRNGTLRGALNQYLESTRPRWSLRHFYWRTQIARAGFILTPSEYCRREVIELLGVPPSRVKATLLAADTSFAGSETPASGTDATLAAFGIRRPYLLYVGGYERHKNVAGLLDVFAKVRRVRPDLSLVVVGTVGLPAEVARAAAGLGLRADTDVVFVVDVTDRLPDLYQSAEVFVSLSWRETFCLPVLEAMSKGLPVVCSSWGAAPEVCGGLARMVDPRDHEAARDAILDMLPRRHSPDLRRELRKWAAGFSWEHTAEETLAAYETALVDRQPVAGLACK